MNMGIPQQIIDRAGHFIEEYGNRLEYLGDHEGQKAWLFRFPDDAAIGFPFLYLFKDGKAEELTGPMVFGFIDLYASDVEDVNKINIE